MSSNDDPIRLALQPGTTPWLQSALSSARSESPSAEDVERLTLRVEGAIVAGLPGPELGAPAKATVSSLSAGKLAIIGIGVAVGIAVGSVWKVKHPPVRVAEPFAAAPSAKPTRPASPEPKVPNTVDSVAPADEPVVAPTKELAKPVAAPQANERDARNTGLNEAALLDAARSALQTDPQRALSLTQEHSRRFPKSLLAQEREVIAIEALNRLGRTGAAKARADNFARLYPGSAHQQKIDQTVRGK